MSEPYFRILSSGWSDAGGTGDILFPPDHPVYAGHFPQRPVVPGVAVLEVIRELLRQRLGMAVRIRSARGIKYLRPILPDPSMVYRLDMHWAQGPDGTLSVQADLLLGDEVCSRIRDLVCVPGSGGTVENQA